MTDPIRVGVIGAHVKPGGGGSWGVRAHLPALAEIGGLTAWGVSTTGMASAREAADLFGVEHAFGDYMELVRHPDVDLVSICVRVPRHKELVLAAIEAGKHIYCEWPLAVDTAEAEMLADAAREAGIETFIGLQGRRSPVIEYTRDLLSGGSLGRVRACSLNHSAPWPVDLPPTYAFLQKRESGASFLSIPIGHSVDTVMDLLGDFRSMTAIGLTQIQQIGQEGAEVERTSLDQVAITAMFENDIVASLRFQGASGHGTGIQLEINCERGDMLISPADPQAPMLQMAALRLQRTTASGLLEDVEIPERYWGVPDAIRVGQPLNVARSYLAVAQRLKGGQSLAPNFDDAVKLHRTLDRIETCAAHFGERAG